MTNRFGTWFRRMRPRGPDPDRQPRPRISYRRPLFLATLTLIWLYFVADLVVELAGVESPLAQMLALLVRSEGVLQVAVYVLLFILLFIVYGAMAPRITDSENNLFNQISDMTGLNIPYLILGGLCLIVLLLAYNWNRLELQLLLLMLTAAFTCLYCGMTLDRPGRGDGGDGNGGGGIGRDFRRFFSALPGIGRFVPEPVVREEQQQQPPGGDQGDDAGGAVGN
ncbi:MAG: hypothetical protein JXA37_04140 [Chloroflexia bacterium]|nr:hypothetical protein [Chloroflexia bacterium]